MSDAPRAGRSENRAPWLRRAFVAGLWLAAIVGWQWWRTAMGLSTTEATERVVDVARGPGGVALYVLLYLARPVVLAPASLLTLAGGALYGPWWGTLVVLVAATGSALVAYWLGRGVLAGAERTPTADTDHAAVSLSARWAAALRANPFETVLLLRLLFLPFDLVSGVAGGLRIRVAPFVAATAVGSVPGTVAFVLLGASLGRIDSDAGGLSWPMLAGSAALFVASIALCAPVAGLSRCSPERRARSPPGSWAMSGPIVVIGSGSGGLTVAVGLAMLGRPTVLVEAGSIGGDCTNTGCIPSKTLLHLSRTGRADPAATLAAVRAQRDALAQREDDEIDANPAIELVRGRGRLADSRTVMVDLASGGVRRIRARAVVIATGARPRSLDIASLPPELLVTNETVFELVEPPRHLAVVGGGAVGVELAGAFARLGSRVTVVQRAGELLSRHHREVGIEVAVGLSRLGVDVRCGVEPVGFDNGSLQLSDRTTLAGVDRVLAAIGRVPNTAELGLDEAGVTVDDGGVTVDGWGRTTARAVYAVGDVTGRSSTTHGANAQGRRVIQKLAYGWLPDRSGPPTVPDAVFCEPEVAAVGVPVDQLDSVCRPGSRMQLRVEIAGLDRAYTDGVTNGVVLVDVVRLTGRILRATIVGPAAAEQIGIFTLAIESGLTMHRFRRLVHPYPSYAEAIRVVADQFTRQTLGDPLGEARARLRSRWT